MSGKSWRCFVLAALAAVFIAAGPAFAADRVIGYETGDIAETVDGATTSWQRVSGGSGAYPAGIHITASTGQAYSGTYAGAMYSGWQENNGEMVYTIETRSTKVSFWYWVAPGTTDGHQGYYYFSVDGVDALANRIPGSPTYSNGGSGWLYFEVTGLTDEVHTFKWTLIDKDYFTSSWYFWDEVTFDPQVQTVAIDIKPGSDPNPINLGSEGVIPVAIFGSDSLDVNTINQTSLEFEGNSARRKGKKEKIGSFSDVDKDGHTDLVVQFPTEGLELSESDTQAVVTGTLLDGTPIEGSDAVTIVPPQ